MFIDNDLLFLAAAAAVYIAVSIIVLFVRLRKGKRPRFLREFLKLAFYLYVVLLLRLTVMPDFRFRPGYLSLNLVPFRTISEYLGFLSSQEVSFGIIRANLLGNVILFVPMGLLVPAIWLNFRRLWKTALLGLLFSMGIELIQMAFSLLGMLYRTTDVDDVILNTSGAIIGYALFAFIRLMLRPLKRLKYERGS